MELKLFDTYDRKVREFVPLEQNRVRMYACGPTVYDYAHIGNLRTYLFEDLLKRILIFNGYEVEHVVNITDVGHLVSDGDEAKTRWSWLPKDRVWMPGSWPSFSRMRLRRT